MYSLKRKILNIFGSQVVMEKKISSAGYVVKKIEEIGDVKENGIEFSIGNTKMNKTND